MSTYKFLHPYRSAIPILLMGALLILFLPGAFTPFTYFSALVLLAILLFALQIVGYFTNKITLSPEGFEYASPGIRVRKPWSAVSRVRADVLGNVNLYFNEPLFKNPFLHLFFYPLVSRSAIQLTPFLDDPLTSPLVAQIKQFAPHCEVPQKPAERV